MKKIKWLNVILAIYLILGTRLLIVNGAIITSILYLICGMAFLIVKEN